MYEILCRSTERLRASAPERPLPLSNRIHSGHLTLRMQESRSHLSHEARACLGILGLVFMVRAKAGLLKGKKATSHWGARAVLPDSAAIATDARVVSDSNIITAAGVSAGIDFTIALVEMLRGKRYTEALVLQGEYTSEPLIKSGTIATASAPIGQRMTEMFAPILDTFRALAKE